MAYDFNWDTSAAFVGGVFSTSTTDISHLSTGILNIPTGQVQAFIDNTNDDEITQLTQDITVAVGNTGAQWEFRGQSFVPVNDFVLTGISIYVNGITATPTDMVVRLCADDGFGFPGAVLCSSAPKASGTLTVPGWNLFHFVWPEVVTAPYLCNNGITYHFTVEDVGAGSPVGSFYTIASDSTQPYAAGIEDFGFDPFHPPTWRMHPGGDLTFKIHSRDYNVTSTWRTPNIDFFSVDPNMAQSGIEELYVEFSNLSAVNTIQLRIIVDETIVATSPIYNNPALLNTIITESDLIFGSFGDTVGEQYCQVEVKIITPGSNDTPYFEMLKIRTGNPVAPSAPPPPPGPPVALPNPESSWKRNRRKNMFGMTPKVLVQIEKTTITGTTWIPIPVKDFEVTFEENSIVNFTINVLNKTKLENGDWLNNLIDFGIIIKVWLYWLEGLEELYFYGYIYGVDYSANSGSDNVTIRCEGALRDCHEKYTVDYTDTPWEPWAEDTYREFFGGDFKGMSIAGHLADLFYTRMGYAVGYCGDHLGKIDNPGKHYFRLGYTKETVIDAARRIADYAGYLFYWCYDRDQVIIQPNDKTTFDRTNVRANYILGTRSLFSDLPKYNTHGVSFEIPTFPIKDFNFNISKDFVINRGEVPSSGESQVHLDPDSITDYGTLNRIFDTNVDTNTNECVLNEITAQAIAINKIRETSKKEIRIIFETIGNNVVRLGDTIYVNAKNSLIYDNSYNYWKVIGIKHTYNKHDGWRTAITAKTYTDI